MGCNAQAGFVQEAKWSGGVATANSLDGLLSPDRYLAVVYPVFAWKVLSKTDRFASVAQAPNVSAGMVLLALVGSEVRSFTFLQGWVGKLKKNLESLSSEAGGRNGSAKIGFFLVLIITNP